jgi:hypothetical protein
VFQRYTERARRVVFFARYESSEYGSPYIESEHLLLRLVREDPALLKRLEGPSNIAEVLRTEIEKHITRREPIATSVEVPLSSECKKALIFAAEEADRLGQKHVETTHVLLGILRVEGSLASTLLTKRGVRPEAVREQLANTPRSASSTPVELMTGAKFALEGFLAGLKWHNSEALISFFAANAEFIDTSGRRWNREEILKGFESLFAPYAKKNASYVVEATLADTHEIFVATVLWKNALLASEQRAWMHRMSIVLLPGAQNWEILLAQVTALHAA